MLLLAYVLNYLDRFMLGVLAQPIKADLNLSDTQFGAIGGVAFALLYSVLGIPFAYLADKTSRSGVITAALALWSGFTALCGVATGYWQLFLFRRGVGIGEAGGVAPSYALIADYFPPERRARSLAIFSLGVPIGGAAGMVMGATIASRLNWRAAFIVMGCVGLLLAPVFRMIVRDLPRRPNAVERAPLGRVFPTLARKPAFWLLSFAGSASSLCGYGLNLWMPSILMRSFGLDIVSAATFMASVFFLGGCLGVVAGGWLADRLGTMNHGWYARLPAIAWLGTAPMFAAGLLAPSLWINWPLLLLAFGLSILWLSPIVAAVQHLVPRPMRSTASASFLLINNLVGLGFGPLLIGRLADGLKASYGADALRGAAVACTSFYFLAAILALFAVKSLTRSWVADGDVVTT
jgi:MFS family permease